MAICCQRGTKTRACDNSSRMPAETGGLAEPKESPNPPASADECRPIKKIFSLFGVDLQVSGRCPSRCFTLTSSSAFKCWLARSKTRLEQRLMTWIWMASSVRSTTQFELSQQVCNRDGSRKKDFVQLQKSRVDVFCLLTRFKFHWFDSLGCRTTAS